MASVTAAVHAYSAFCASIVQKLVLVLSVLSNAGVVFSYLFGACCDTVVGSNASQVAWQSMPHLLD